MKTLLYAIFKLFIKTQFFFYTKKIKVSGLENIPEESAILFTANHPNGLLDPLLIASSISRKTHFLVKADVFKNPKIATIFNWLGMMPIYRIRDGVKQVRKNNLIFKKCSALLKRNKVLLIFPEGSHSKKRTIRPLSKGFTRIVFGCIEEDITTEIYIIPVGITYQDSSKYPSEVALQFGKPLLANNFYDAENLPTATRNLKQEVTQQLEALTVHIKNDENYTSIENKLNKLDLNYTNVNHINQIIKTECYTSLKTKKETTTLLKRFVILNSVIPYFIWKKIDSKITEIEFKDTFRLGINTFLFPFFYALQSCIVSYFFNWKTGIVYFISSLLLVILHTKTATT